MNFTLHFNNTWEQPQLVRSGGEHSPLEMDLRTVTLSQYLNDKSSTDRDNPRHYDFVVDDETGNIVPHLSTGKRDDIHSICLLPTFVDELISASRLWVFLNEYMVVFRVFVSPGASLFNHKQSRKFDSWLKCLIAGTCSLMFCNAETQRTMSIRLGMSRKICFKYFNCTVGHPLLFLRLAPSDRPKFLAFSKRQKQKVIT